MEKCPIRDKGFSGKSVLSGLKVFYNFNNILVLFPFVFHFNRILRFIKKISKPVSKDVPYKCSTLLNVKRKLSRKKSVTAKEVNENWVGLKFY